MRSWRPSHRQAIGVPLAVAFLCGSSGLSGCDKAEEVAEKAAVAEADNADDNAPEEPEKAADEKEVEKEIEKEAEPIPVEPMHTGLDLMLSFIPGPETEFFIIRDASVLEEYYEEGTRFLDTPVEKLSNMDGVPADFKEFSRGFEQARLKGKEIITAMQSSGLRLKDGGALFKTKQGKSLIIFASDDPGALSKLAVAMGKSEMGEGRCRALDGHAGWSICGSNEAIEGYKPAEDPKAVRNMLQEKLAGVALDDANLIVSIEDDDDDNAGTFAITTLPGLVHVAGVIAFDGKGKQGLDALEVGEAKTLANVQPGAGFIWARTKPEVLNKALAGKFRGSPPEVKNVMETFTGEWILAGSVDPGGLVFQAGISDAAPYAALWDEAMRLSVAAPKELPEMPGSKLTIEKPTIKHGTAVADALHVGVTGIEEADIIRAFAAVHLDAWAFAANNSLTVAVGPDAANVGKLLDAPGGGPSPEMLRSLPAPLAAGFKRNEVSLAIHMPADFLQGKYMHTLARAALKNVPDANPDMLIALASMAAPVSSSSIWFEQAEGSDHPILHMAVQSVGHRATDEGKAALEAAHKVTEGTDPETAFKPLTEKYGSSSMAFAYHTRAGTDGPGSLVGSGVGAVAVAGAIGYARFVGAANEALADDLGVKLDDPEPEIIPEHVPVAPEMEEKDLEPKEDIVVEPKQEPKVPESKPSVDDPAKKKKGKKKKGKKKKGKKKKGKKKKG